MNASRAEPWLRRGMGLVRISMEAWEALEVHRFSDDELDYDHDNDGGRCWLVT